MQITRRSPLTGLANTREINVTYAQLDAWYSGQLIQDACPNLSAEDREFLISGLTPEDWQAVFTAQEGLE